MAHCTASVPTATPLSRSHQPREKETGQGDLINIRAKPSSASLRLQPRKKPSAAAGSEKRHCNKEDPIGRSAKKDVVCESGSNEDELFSLDERAKALHNRSWGQEISTEEEVEGGVWVHFESRFGEGVCCFQSYCTMQATSTELVLTFRFRNGVSREDSSFDRASAQYPRGCREGKGC